MFSNISHSVIYSRLEVSKIAKKSNNNFKFSTIHLVVILLGALVVALSFFSLNVKTQASEKLNYQAQVSKRQCDTTGNPVINVTQDLSNDADSGEAGNYWGYDTFSRHIQVWKQADSSYCALVDYNGKFVGVAGQKSPGNTGILTGSEKGTIHGGYRVAIQGTLKSNPSWKTNGNVGKFDYKCDLSGNCPGAVSWDAQYFNTGAVGYTFDMTWWGWTYTNGQHTWINSSDGNSGDII